MLSIEQNEHGVKIRTDGNLPDLVCDLVVLYQVVSARGAALGYDVSRLVGAIACNDYLRDIENDYWTSMDGSRDEQ